MKDKYYCPLSKNTFRNFWTAYAIGICKNVQFRSGSSMDKRFPIAQDFKAEGWKDRVRGGAVRDKGVRRDEEERKNK
jgi:hypothetical protein